MTNVICRAELRGSPTRPQYDEFHIGMKQLGLNQTIAKDGKVFHLPTGEYLGVNLSHSLPSLRLQIDLLALRITGDVSKQTLSPVVNPADIYIGGLEEDRSYESELGEFAAMFPLLSAHSTNVGYSTLVEFANASTTVPRPSAIPVSADYGFLTGMKSPK